MHHGAVPEENITHRPLHTAEFNMAETFTSIGFIGLGTMGYPMALNLVTKLPKVNFYVNDVFSDPVKKLVVAASNGNVISCQTAREVAEQTVCLIFNHLICISLSHTAFLV